VSADFQNTVTDTTISGNTITAAVDFQGAFNNVIMTSNKIESTAVFASIVESTIGDNFFGGDIDIQSGVLRTTITGNVMDGSSYSLDVQNNITDSTVIGNRLNGNLRFAATVQDTIVSDNVMEDSLYFSGNLTRVKITGNTSSNAQTSGNLEISGGSAEKTSVMIDNNTFYQFDWIGQTGRKVIITNNHFEGDTFHIHNALAEAVISGNVIEATVGTGLVQFDDLDRSNVSNNMFATGQTPSWGGPTKFTGTMTDTVISGNTFNWLELTSASTSDDITLTGNITLDEFKVAGAVDDSIISGNKFDSVVINAAITNTNISDNVVETTTTIDTSTSTLTDVIVNQNIFKDNVGFSSGVTLTRTEFVNNIMRGAFAMSSASTAVDMSFTDNTVLNDVTINALLLRCVINNNTVGTLKDGSETVSSIIIGTAGHEHRESRIEGNIVSESITVNGSSITGSTITGNRGKYLVLPWLDESTATGNRFVTTTTDVAVTVANISNSTVSGNLFSSTSATSPMTFGDWSNVIFDGNDAYQAVGQNITIGDIVGSKVSDSVFTCSTLDIDSVDYSSIDNIFVVGDVNITPSGATGVPSALKHSHFTNSNIVGNVVLEGTTVAMSKSHFTGNTVDVNLTIEKDVMASHVKSNNVGNVFAIYNDVLNSSIDENIVKSSMVVSGGTTGSTFEGNVIGGLLSFAAISGSVIGTNRITGVLSASGNVGYSTFADNSLSGLFSFDGGTMDNVSITGNTSTQGLDINSVVTDTMIGDNMFSAFTLTSSGSHYRMTVTGNGFASMVVDGGGSNIVDSTIIGNTISGAFTLDAATTVAMSGSTFADNRVGGISTWGYNVLDCTITGNDLVGVAVFSGTLTDTAIGDNHFESDVDFESTVDTSTISGNVFDGASTSVDFQGTVTDTSFTSNTSLSDINFVAIDALVFTGNNLHGAAATLTVTGDIALSGDSKACVINDNHMYDISLTNAAPLEFAFVGNHVVNNFSVTNGTLQKVTAIGNKIGAAVSVLGITESTFSNNVIGASMSAGAVSNESVIESNSIQTTMSFTSTIADSSVLGNTVGGAFSISGGLTNVSIKDNHFGSTVVLPAVTSTDIIFSNNHTGSKVTVASGGTTYSRFVMSGNNIGDDATDSVKIEISLFDSVISDNNCTANFTIDAGAGVAASLYESTLANNNISGDLLINYDGIANGARDCAIQFSTITGNTVYGAVTFKTEAAGAAENVLYRVGMSNNVFGNTTIQHDINSMDYTVRASTISDNVFNGFLTIDHVSASDAGEVCVNSTISGNRVVSNFTMGTDVDGTSTALVLDNTVISDNSFGGSATFASATRTGTTSTYSNAIISNNAFAGALELNGKFTDGVVEGNTYSSTFAIDDIESSQIMGNGFVGTFNISGAVAAATIGENVFSSTFAVTGTVIGTTVNGNAFSSTVDFDDTSSSSFYYSSFSGNTIVGALDFAGNINMSSVAGNNVQGSTSVGTLLESSVSSNFFDDGFVVDLTTDRTTFSGNSVDQSGTCITFTGAVNDSVITSNYSLGNIAFSSTVSNSTIGENTAEGTFSIADLLTLSTVNANTISSTGSFEQITEATISNNTFGGDVDVTSTVSGATISGNIFSGATDSLDFANTITNTVIEGNRLDAELEINGQITGCTISGNIVEGITDVNAIITTSAVTGNTFVGAWDGAGVAITSSKVGGNVFGSTVNVESVTNVVWSNNRHANSLTFQANSGTVVTADNLNLSNNLFEGTVTIRHASGVINNATDSLRETSIISNTFALASGDALVIGYSADDDHIWTRSLFMNNCGTGDFEFYGYTPESAMNEIHIIGNNMNGGLNFTFTSGDIDNPSGLGTDEHMIALNFFTGYNITGATWTDNPDKALGWGKTDSTGTVTAEATNR